MGFVEPELNLSPKVSDEIRKTTCYMCACRCGIDVHMKNDKVAYIEGNRDHPVNKGVLCAKGSAGIMQVNAPSRLRAPLKRVGERGSGEFEEISWDEALQLAQDGWNQYIKKIQKNLHFLREGINHKALHRSGHRALVPQIMLPMVAFVQ